MKQQIAQADVAGFDETGLRVVSKLHWVHCARTGKYTLITCHPKRGRTGIDDAGVLARFTGVAVHDAWAPYDTYPDPGHQLCCAHALRELQGIADLAAPEAIGAGPARPPTRWSRSRTWSPTPSPLGASTLDEDALATQLHLYRCAAQIGITETAARGDVTKRHNALAHRLIDRQDDYLRFTTNWRIPPDNNGSNATSAGSNFGRRSPVACAHSPALNSSARSEATCHTAAKHGRPFFDTLVMLAEGRPWMPA